MIPRIPLPVHAVANTFGPTPKDANAAAFTFPDKPGNSTSQAPLSTILAAGGLSLSL